MAEAKCPLIKDNCMKEGCLWYAEGAKKCAVVAVGMLVNTMHDMGVTAYKKCIDTTAEDK
jgi:hypothetical protein